MKAICGYCDATVGEDAVEHFRDLHPMLPWELRRWPDGEQVLIDDEPSS